MQLECCDPYIDAVPDTLPRVDWSCIQDIGFLKKGKFGHVRKVIIAGGLTSLQQDDSTNHIRCSSTEQHRRPLVLALKHMNPYSNDPQDAGKQLANEAKILSSLNHRNVIKLRGVCSGSFSDSFRSNPRGYFLLLDLLQETLRTRLDRWREDKPKTTKLSSLIHRMISKRISLLSPRIDNVDRCQEIYTRAQDAMVIDIARGLEYLYENQVVWRDLKPANIGYYHNNEGAWTAKLIDFGLACKIQECVEGECCGSQAYMAPETMRGDRFTPKGDVFSFGVLLSEVCSLRVPYAKSRRNTKQMTKEERLNLIRKQVQDDGLQPMDNLEKIIPCSETCDIINDCWDQPKYRPNPTTIAARLEGILFPSKSRYILADKEVYRDRTHQTERTYEDTSE